MGDGGWNQPGAKLTSSQSPAREKRKAGSNGEPSMDPRSKAHAWGWGRDLVCFVFLPFPPLLSPPSRAGRPRWRRLSRNGASSHSPIGRSIQTLHPHPRTETYAGTRSVGLLPFSIRPQPVLDVARDFDELADGGRLRCSRLSVGPRFARPKCSRSQRTGLT
ncbi:hypothetical protein BT67DRAFT_253516 [Trichocladium antarcticum]|uniref:Uncharacterized protein n=1 Tax=Trichocladium antarcticum TaxID=1450529 RepID=A0AAN6ZF96_9PEZI|nr:hypothetical protein BT67DRAFT_253516 [Trichocladium antarcticum]